MPGRTIAERADAFAKGSGLYRLTLIDAQQRPRPLRWWSIVVVAAIVTGYCWMVVVTHQPHRSVIEMLAAPLLFFGAFSASNALRFIGPRLQPLNGRALDEHERDIKARAGHLSGLVLTVAAIMGCFYQAVAPILHWWHPSTTYEWVQLGMAIEGLAFVLPVLFASWLLPPIMPDDEA